MKLKEKKSGRFSFPSVKFATTALLWTVALWGTTSPLLGEITVTNSTDGEEVTYRLALLEGRLDGESAGADRLIAENLSSNEEGRIQTGQTDGTRFKILVPLVLGENRILLSTGSQRREWTLIFRPDGRAPIVRLFYGIDRDTPEPSAVRYAAITRRLATAGLLLQTAVAERENDLGRRRKTFRLETDSNDEIHVRIVRFPKPSSVYARMTRPRLFDEIYRELAVHFPDETARNLVVLDFAPGDRFPGRSAEVAAQGGGKLAMVGFATFPLWPETFDEILPALTDPSPQDTLGNPIDGPESAWRRTRWGAVSTTLGATLHELGHTFGLADAAPEDKTVPELDFMNRGFPHFGRIFLVLESPSALNQERTPISPESEPAFFGGFDPSPF